MRQSHEVTIEGLTQEIHEERRSLSLRTTIFWENLCATGNCRIPWVNLIKLPWQRPDPGGEGKLIALPSSISWDNLIKLPWQRPDPGGPLGEGKLRFTKFNLMGQSHEITVAKAIPSRPMKRGEAYSFTKFNFMRQSNKITVGKAGPGGPWGEGELIALQSSISISWDNLIKLPWQRPGPGGPWGEGKLLAKFNLMGQSHKLSWQKKDPGGPWGEGKLTALQSSISWDNLINYRGKRKTQEAHEARGSWQLYKVQSYETLS
jgi:hypothetical protein